MKPLKIGKVTIDCPVVLAPMAGVTDLPFRLLCREMGVGLLSMEMVSAKAILYKNRNTESLMEIAPGENPIALQLFGSDPEILGEIAAQIQNRPFDILDFNMGCPVPKVVNNQEGSALMKQPELVREIASSLVKASEKPVTVKSAKDSTMPMSMRWRLPKSWRTAALQRLRSMDAPESSIIRGKRTGRSSGK